MRLMVDMLRSGGGLVAVCLLAGVIGAASAAPAQSDVRVLIDISGSMRQNDPANLRRPALRMLAGLLQPGTQAGVWTFARWVNNLVPVAEVDAAWKRRTQSLSHQISSPGQFTNIEEVLDRASGDWRGAPDEYARHLVLLTDGMVDVSKDADANAQSRQRIVEALLPRLKAAGVKVHTIALSARADHDLMQRLAGETGGHYQQVDRADQLQRVFLRMFETVGNPDSVPLEGNRFVVDSSVNEATVLLFSKPDAPPAALVSPSGVEFTDSDLPAGVAWFRDQGYDLITIASPEKGEWRLQAEVDPDNRVMIVTDLKLQVSEIPAYLAAGERIGIEASLSNRGKLVSRQAFLRLLQVNADAGTAGAVRALGVNDAGRDGDEKAADGRYRLSFSEPRAADAVDLRIAVDSPTFMREKRFRLAVREPVVAAIRPVADALTLDVRLQTAVMRDDATLSAWQEDADGERTALQLDPGADNTWTAVLAEPGLPSFVQVEGSSRLDSRVVRTLGPFMAPGVAAPAEPAAPTAVAAMPAAEQPDTDPDALDDGADQATAEVDADAPEEEDEAASWALPAMVFGAFNVLLLIGAAVWFVLRRRSGGGDDELDIEDLIEPPGNPGDEAAAHDKPGAREDAA